MSRLEFLIYCLIFCLLSFIMGFINGVENEKFSRDHANLKLQQCQAQLVSQ